MRRRLRGRPVFDEKVRAYLTLRCNLTCAFCVNTHVDGGQHLREYALLSPQQWIRILGTLGRDVVLTGGEPLLYPGLAELVQGVDPSLAIRVYSNLSVPVARHASCLQRKKLSFYGSYHPGYTSEKVFLENVRLLARERVPFTVHAIDVPGKVELERLIAQRLGADAPPVTIDPDQRPHPRASKAFRKKVSCRRNSILIAPDGTRYHCVSRMLRRVAPFEDLLAGPFTTSDRTDVCGDYGFCAPCDELGESSVTFLAGDEPAGR